MSPPPFWNLRARYRGWSRENQNQAKLQIAAIMALSFGLIAIMFVVTMVIVYRLLQ